MHLIQNHVFPCPAVPLILEQQHITAVEHIIPTLQNIVATVNLDCHHDPNTIVLSMLITLNTIQRLLLTILYHTTPWTVLLVHVFSILSPIMSPYEFTSKTHSLSTEDLGKFFIHSFIDSFTILP